MVTMDVGGVFPMWTLPNGTVDGDVVMTGMPPLPVTAKVSTLPSELVSTDVHVQGFEPVVSGENVTVTVVGVDNPVIVVGEMEYSAQPVPTADQVMSGLGPFVLSIVNVVWTDCPVWTAPNGCDVGEIVTVVADAGPAAASTAPKATIESAYRCMPMK
jgi:hypothetical protein